MGLDNFLNSNLVSRCSGNEPGEGRPDTRERRKSSLPLLFVDGGRPQMAAFFHFSKEILAFFKIKILMSHFNPS